jgi:hypothetical protein
MYAKMMAVSKKAQEDKDAYMAENDELKKFKADVLGQRFAFEVESTLSEAAEDMPKDKIEEYRERSKNFSLENINVWANEVIADAHRYSKGKKPSDGITRMALGWVNNDKKDDTNLENGWV